MNKFPCKECIIGTVCSDACDKIHNDYIGGIYGFIVKYRCCPDCGSTDGVIFYEFEFINCTTCNSLFNSSLSEKPRNIKRWDMRKYNGKRVEVYDSFDMTFGAFVDKIYEFRSMSFGPIKWEK
jgi:hypothetical protein